MTTNTDPSTTLIEFPCDFVLKIFGRATDTFEREALSIVSAHVEEIPEDAIKTRLSKDGKYLAITVTIPVDTKEQLDTIYKQLSSHPEVLMVL